MFHFKNVYKYLKLGLFAGAFSVLTAGSSFAEDDRPNVLFILADDLGWRDLSNEGSNFYESPNIDRIANQGMKFTQGYATCQVCSPSRASIMTGKYPARLKITDWIGAAMSTGWQRNTPLLPASYLKSLPLSETTIAESFRDDGYRTFFAGKWHLGGKGSYPENHGFETNVGGHEKGSPPGGFFSPYSNPKMESGPKGEQLPLRLGAETANWIEQHKDERFFAFLSFYSVHSPIQTTRKLWEKYRDKASTQPKPEQRFIVDRTTPVRQVQDNPLYAGMVESMDDAVGIVLAKLDELSLTNNTIIVFTSDNGGVSAGDGKATSNLPLRGGKGRQWEGGIREPFYICVPGLANGQCDIPVTGTDFYPTLLELCGIPLKPDQHVDGVSLVQLLKTQPNTAHDSNAKRIAERNLYWHYPHYGNQGGEPSSIIRQGDWKLISYYESSKDELYDLSVDPSESKNVYSKNVVVGKRLKQELEAWLKQTEARFPTTNPRFNKIQFERQEQRIREKMLPNLEKQHAKFLSLDYAPSQGWWEDTGK